MENVFEKIEDRGRAEGIAEAEGAMLLDYFTGGYSLEEAFALFKSLDADRIKEVYKEYQESKKM